MEKFQYYNPTKILFGKGMIEQVGEELRSQDLHHVLILYGGHHIEIDGTLDIVKQSLHKAHITYCCAGGIKPNPRVSHLKQYEQLAVSESVDGILAIGGGSVIDVAKAVSITALSNPSIRDLLLGNNIATGSLPVHVILTIAGSGSESSCSLVLTIDEGNLKRSYDDDRIRPVTAILDPLLTLTLPRRQFMAGAIDILMHTMERYFSPSTHTDLIDRMSEGLLCSVMDNIDMILQDVNQVDAHANIMWAGSLSHNGLLETGRISDWACHRLEHELSGAFNVIHGEGLSALWGSWAMLVYPQAIPRFVDFAIRVMKLSPSETQEETARKGIVAFVSWMKSIGMPVSIQELGLALTTEDITMMSKNCLLNQPSIGQCKKLYDKDIVEIYYDAIGGVCHE